MNFVIDFLEKKINLKRNDSIVVGVSAGPDSMFLLYILIELRRKIGFEIIVAHVNHNVRIESNEEEIFLKNYCESKNVIFEKMKIEKYNNENFHAYARELRYNFYKDLINKYNAAYLMTAHHGDDLIETILMRLTRGSSLSGYHGISLINDVDNYKIVRPLLFLTKDEIKQQDDKLNIPYRIDKSNESDKYTRNRYRKNILPFLKQENSNVHLKFLKFSNIIEDANNFIEKSTNDILSKVYIDNKIDINLLKEEDIFIQKMVLSKVLKEIYDNLSKIEDKHIDAIINLIKRNKSGMSLNLPNNILARVDYDYLVFIKPNVKEEYKLELVNNLVLPNGMKFFNIDDFSNGNDTLHIDSSTIKLPLYVRNKKDGDYIEVKGLNGKKKVSQIFIDCKVPREERKNYPVVVTSDDKIIWIPKLKKSKYDSKNHEKCDIIYKCL